MSEIDPPECFGNWPRSNNTVPCALCSFGLECMQSVGDAEPAAAGAIDIQIGGDHYKKLGNYQPWLVLQEWLTPEEFRGYMKGTAIAYLAREKDKGGAQDIAKAAHTLRGWLEMTNE